VCKSKKRLDGKVAIVTGSNSGIGYETALDFAYRGARVIMACRDSKKAEQAAKEIIKLTKNKNVDVEFLDLSDLDTVRSFANKMNETLDRLDILVNNAGIMMTPKWETKQGYEIQFGTNHLGHFLLTNLLIDIMVKTGSARVINVSSLAHNHFQINWDDINLKTNYNTIAAYSQSKIANILFTKELANKYGDKGVLCFSLHPGAVRTELMKYAGEGLFRWFPYLLRIVYPFWMIVTKSSKEGAQTSIFLAVEDEISKYNGYYFSDCKPKQPSKFARNQENASRLWEMSSKMVQNNNKIEETNKTDNEDINDCEKKIKQDLQENKAFLPKLLNTSVILKNEHIEKLSTKLITRALEYNWKLSFSTENNGFSLQSLYRSLASIESPCLIVILDTNKNVFGAMTVSKVYESKHSFYGTGESFLFTFVPEFKVFHWTGENSFFIRSLSDGLEFGCSNGKHGLWFDNDLCHGHSQKCSTYDNEILSSTENFTIESLEVWTFSNNS
jgi:NAD(P)-dependent dehydrogenase (short-subunit alcohol dehydrogenase family)